VRDELEGRDAHSAILPFPLLLLDWGICRVNSLVELLVKEKQVTHTNTRQEQHYKRAHEEEILVIYTI